MLSRSLLTYACVSPNMSPHSSKLNGPTEFALAKSRKYSSHTHTVTTHLGCQDCCVSWVKIGTAIVHLWIFMALRVCACGSALPSVTPSLVSFLPTAFMKLWTSPWLPNGAYRNIPIDSTIASVRILKRGGLNRVWREKIQRVGSVTPTECLWRRQQSLEKFLEDGAFKESKQKRPC